VTTQFTSCAQNVHHRPETRVERWHFLTFPPKQLGIFSPNLTRLLNVHMYARVQLSPNVTKLCGYAILRATTQRAFRSMLDILSTLWWSRLIRHNFVKIAGNWIKTCSPASIGTYNRRAKFGLKIPNHFGKMPENFEGGLTHCSAVQDECFKHTKKTWN